MKRQGIKCLSLDEVRQLRKYLSDKKSLEREYFLIDLTLQTGLRISEVCNLNVSDVLDRKKLEVRGKGDKARAVPIHADLKMHIENYMGWKRKKGEGLDPEAPLFISRKRNRLSVRAIQRAFEKTLMDAGINENYHFHSLRHTYASAMYRQHKNIRVVQELLGHSRLDTTMIYTYVSDEDKEAAVEALLTAYKGEKAASESQN